MRKQSYGLWFAQTNTFSFFCFLSSLLQGSFGADVTAVSVSSLSTTNPHS
jgi:hypothetical protein